MLYLKEIKDKALVYLEQPFCVVKTLLSLKRISIKQEFLVIKLPLYLCRAETILRPCLIDPAF